jgi:hypothetical protein
LAWINSRWIWWFIPNLDTSFRIFNVKLLNKIFKFQTFRASLYHSGLNINDDPEIIMYLKIKNIWKELELIVYSKTKTWSVWKRYKVSYILISEFCSLFQQKKSDKSNLFFVPTKSKVLQHAKHKFIKKNYGYWVLQ